MWAEVGHFYALQSKPNKAVNYFVSALYGGADVGEIARDIVASPSFRDKVFSRMTSRHVQIILDAVFPKDPFAR